MTRVLIAVAGVAVALGLAAGGAPAHPLATPPGVPTNVSATPGDAQAVITFDETDTGGLPLTLLIATSKPGGITATKACPCPSPYQLSVGGLKNGTAYTFTVQVRNAQGLSPESAPSSPVTPGPPPDPPTNVKASAGNEKAKVKFTAPPAGIYPVTGYTVLSSVGTSVDGPSSPITVTGLTNGTTYTFTVVARNAIGTSAPSAPSNPVKPHPQAPPPPPTTTEETATGPPPTTTTEPVTTTPPVTTTAPPPVETTPAPVPVPKPKPPKKRAPVPKPPVPTLPAPKPTPAPPLKKPAAPIQQPAPTHTTTTTTTRQTTTQQQTTTRRTTTSPKPPPPAPPPTTTTAGSPPAPPPSPTPRTEALGIEIDGDAGIAITDASVSVHGEGFAPGSTVSIYAHSAPVLIGQATADANGSFAASVHMPRSLAPGGHEVIVRGRLASGRQVSKSERFTVATGGLLGTVGSIPPGRFATMVPFHAASHKGTMLALTASAAAVLGALSAALAGAAGGLGTRRGRSRSEAEGHKGGGYLEDVDLERQTHHRHGHAFGDRSPTWRWPGTAHLDRFSAHKPERLARISPVVGRVLVDGDYLRAMLGSASLLLYVPAIGLGIVAAHQTGWEAIPPSLALFLALLGLGILDSMVGYAAGLAFAGAVIAGGGLRTTNSFRELCGIVLIWFAVPLGAAAARPLRRHIDWTLDGVWDRAADFVVAGLFAAFLATEMTEALNGLGGYELSLAARRYTVALAVLGFVLLRIVAETIAAHYYPTRLAAVTHHGELEPGTVQVALSLVVQIALFVFIALPYMHWTWELAAGTVIFFTPLAAWLFYDRLPKSAAVAKWRPVGVAKWTFVIVAGVGLQQLLAHLVDDPQRAIAYGFLVLFLPILLVWALDLFVAEDEEEEEEEGSRFHMSWPLRLTAIPAIGVCAYLVLVVV